MKVRLVYCLPIVLQRLPLCNNYCHAHIVICKLEKRPPTNYRPPIVVTYYLQHLQTLCAYCLPPITILPSQQTLNLISTSLMMPSNGSYCHVVERTFYFKTKNYYYYYFKEEKKN
jgi:hypothetical protein